MLHSAPTRTTAATVLEVVADHEVWLKARRAPSTVEKYHQHLQAFTAWAGERPLGEITAREIEFEFLGPWAANVTKATRRNRINALRSLFDFAERFDLIERNVMRRIERPPREERMGDWLRAEQDAAVLGAAVTPLERTIIYLLRYTGLRVSEACALRWTDIDLDAQRLTVRESKTPAGRRTIPIHPCLVPILRGWQQRNGTTYVLGTRNGTPMFPQFVWRVVKRVGERAGIEGLHPHSLRRTYGSSLINDGLRLEVISKLLGHSSTTVTEHSYAALLDETIAREVMALWTAAA